MKLMNEDKIFNGMTMKQTIIFFGIISLLFFPAGFVISHPSNFTLIVFTTSVVLCYTILSAMGFI